MTLTNLRTLIKSQIADITSQTTVSDADIDLLIRDASFKIADLYNANLKQFYQRTSTINIVTDATKITISTLTPPISETVGSLISAYIQDTIAPFPITPAYVVTPQEVFQAEIEGRADCYVAATGAGIMFHQQTAPLAPFSLNILYYSYPIANTQQIVEVDVPAKEINFLVDIVREKLYHRFNLTIPRTLTQALYEHEVNL